MASTVGFTDGVGAATLSNQKPVPGDRFARWEASSPTICDQEEALGTGQLFAFTFRSDHLVTFQVTQIPVSQLSIMLRLQRHLTSGGTVSVNTGDASSRVYATCCLQKGADPSPKLTDPKEREYTVTLALRDVSGSPVDMLCAY